MDPFSVWFSALEEVGECTCVRFLREVDGELEVIPVAHAQHDGLGAFSQLVRQYYGLEVPPPLSRETKAPSIFRRFRLLMNDIKASHKTAVPWRRFRRTVGRAYPRAWAVVRFTEEETRRLLGTPKGTAGYNARLLWALDRVLAPALAEPMAAHMWLMPANMRGPVRVKDPYSNVASQLAIRLEENASPLDVHRAVATALREGVHWGAWDSFRILARLGKRAVLKFVRKYYERPGHAWLGTFSNLGDWSRPGVGASEAWYVAPPVTISQPIGAGCIVWGGRICVMLQLHDALQVSKADVEAWAQAWRELTVASLEASSADAPALDAVTKKAPELGAGPVTTPSGAPAA